MPDFLRAVAVCGPICSGKTSVVRYLSESRSWDIVSFGEYVRQLAQVRHLPETRQSYQKLGHDVLSSSGPDKFLASVIESSKPISHTHLFDGVRHTSILEAMRKMYDTVCVIYLVLSDRQRYERYLSRGAHGDPMLPYDGFLDLSDQPIEHGVAEIASVATFLVDASMPYEELLGRVEAELDRLGFSKESRIPA